MSKPTPASDLPEALADLSPACTLVYCILDRHGPLASSEVADYGLMSPRTTRHALRRLGEAGLVECRTDHRDARRQLYRTTDAE